MRNLAPILLVGTLAFFEPTVAPAAETSDLLTKTMELIEQWVVAGHYDNSAQVEGELNSSIPENLRHRPMYQLFVPVDLPQIDGITHFQQAYADGNYDMIVRVGITQYFSDPESGSVRMRELHFHDEQIFYDAHKDPTQLESLTLDDVWWDEGCDFYLLVKEQESEIRGPMNEGTCILQDDLFGVELAAQDEVVILPGEVRFLGRYVDADGQVMWGNESDELNKLVFTGMAP